jgi:hypothetical protein
MVKTTAPRGCLAAGSEGLSLVRTHSWEQSRHIVVKRGEERPSQRVRVAASQHALIMAKTEPLS